MQNQLVMFEEELNQVNAICEQLHRDSNAQAVLIIDKDGQAISMSGETDHLDITSLASLIAGNIAAAGGIASLLSEKEFAGQFHEGEKIQINYTVVGGRVVMVVLFDKRSSLGLVRLRGKKAAAQLTEVVEVMVKKSETGGQQVLAEITDDDIDNLFND